MILPNLAFKTLFSRTIRVPGLIFIASFALLLLVFMMLPAFSFRGRKHNKYRSAKRKKEKLNLNPIVLVAAICVVSRVNRRFYIQVIPDGNVLFIFYFFSSEAHE